MILDWGEGDPERVGDAADGLDSGGDEAVDALKDMAGDPGLWGGDLG